MEIMLQSDGQLYPPKPPPKPKEPPCPPPPPKEKQALPLEELLLSGVAYLILKNQEKPDLPLLLALLYILLDPGKSLKL